MIWYWYNAQKCQTRSTNTIAFSWENLKLYWSSLWKVPIKSSELLNISTKLKNSEFAPRIQNHFLGNARQSLKLCKKFFPILGLLINFFWSLWKYKNESSEWLNIVTRLKKCQICSANTKPFSGESEANLETLNKF